MEDVGPGFLQRLIEWHITVLPVVPSIASALLRLARRNPSNVPPLQIVTNTGAQFPQSYVEELRRLFPHTQLFLMFGLTECKRVSILLPQEYLLHRQSVGRPLSDTESLIVDDDAQSLPPGTMGELVVRGPHVMAGYWRAPELTATRFRPFGPGLERALFTGDICSVDQEGFLYFHGRRDDIFKRRGFRVSAIEIEAAAMDIVGITEAALVPNLEEGAILFVVGTRSPAEIMAGLRERLEDYKVPSKVVTLESLPRTGNGKVDRQELRKVAEAVL